MGSDTQAEPVSDLIRHAAPRVPVSAVETGGEVRLMPIGAVTLINLSETGALVETKSRLAVGASVTLYMGGPQPKRIKGRVVRNQVCAIHHNQGLSYQLGIAFDQRTQMDLKPGFQPTSAPIGEATSEAPAPPSPPHDSEPVNQW